MRGGKALLEPAAREGGRLLLVLRADRLAKEAHLVVHVQAEHLLLELLVLGHARDAAVHALVKVVGDQRAEARPYAKARVLVHGPLDLVGLEQHGVTHANLAQVRDREEERPHAGL